MYAPHMSWYHFRSLSLNLKNGTVSRISPKVVWWRAWDLFSFFLIPQHLRILWQISSPWAIKCHCKVRRYYLYSDVQFYLLVFPVFQI